MRTNKNPGNFFLLKGIFSTTNSPKLSIRADVTDCPNKESAVLSDIPNIGKQKLFDNTTKIENMPPKKSIEVYFLVPFFSFEKLTKIIADKSPTKFITSVTLK